MPEFEFKIRAKSEKAANALRNIIGDNPLHYEITETELIPDTPSVIDSAISTETESATDINGGGMLFQKAREYLKENPGLPLTSFMKNEKKTPEEEQSDLAALVILAKEAIEQKNPVALEGLVKLYDRVGPIYRYWMKKNRNELRTLSYDHFQSGFLKQLEESSINNVRATRKQGKRESNDLLRPSELRVLILTQGYTGEKLKAKDLSASEGVKSVEGKVESSVRHIASYLLDYSDKTSS